MSSEEADANLAEERRNIFAILRKRMAKIRFDNLPRSYYNGQEYIEDARRTKCLITAETIFPGQIPTYEFWLNGARVSVSQRGNVLVIEIYKTISQRLWDDLRLISHGERFIIGYIASYLPRINRYLLDQRYISGHLLVRTFSIVELFGIRVVCQGRMVLVRWPVSFPPFPPNATLAPEMNEIYIRDYIDACSSYFRNDYDDCLRRIVTSAENFFRARNWMSRRESILRRIIRILKRGKKPNPNSFRRVMADNLPLHLISGEIMNENMKHIYGVRNKIVHDGFRMSTSSGIFCSKALATLKYMLLRNSGNTQTSNYIHHLHMQFMMQCGVFGENNNIDMIEKMMRRKTAPGAPIIDSPETLETTMFSALRFDLRDKNSI